MKPPSFISEPDAAVTGLDEGAHPNVLITFT